MTFDCAAVLIDCVLTTKVIIPCAMVLLGTLNFWPRRFDKTRDDRTSISEVLFRAKIINS